MRPSIGPSWLVGWAILVGLALAAPASLALAADPNPAAQATCATDDGVSCTIRRNHEIPSGTLLDYGDRQVILAGHLTLAAGPGPRSLTLRTTGDVLIRAGGRIGTENRAHHGRDGGDLTLTVGGSLTLHGRLDLDGHASQGTGGHLTLTTGRDLTVSHSGAILADGNTGGTLDLTIGGTLTTAGRLKARGHPSHGQGGTITLTVGGATTLTVPGRLRVDGATAGRLTLTVAGPLTLDGDVTANGKQGGTLTLEASGPVTLGPQALLTVEGQGRAGRAGTLTATFCGPSASLAGRLRAVGEGGADGGSLTVQSRGPLTISGRLKAFGEGRGAQGGTIRVAATAGLTFTRTARLNAEGHPEGTITLASPDPLDPNGARIEPPFTRVPLGPLCGLSPLQVARANHIATLLKDGTVLLAGGRNGSGPTDSLERFDPATGSFSAHGSRLLTPREAHTATVLPDGRVLLLGGTNGSSILDSGEFFDPTSGTVTALGSQLSARSGHTATLLLDGRVLFTGGTDGTTVLGSALLFDPATQTVRPPPGALVRARRGHTATLLPDGTVLLVGGTDGTTTLDSAEVFDPGTQTFLALPSRLSTARFAHTATLLPDGTVLILGGTSDGTTSLASGERFNPATASFEPSAIALLRARRDHTATLLGPVLSLAEGDGTLLITGGFGSGPLPTAERHTLGLTDTTSPTVVAVRPPDQATDVPSDSRVALRFSEPINPVTLTPNSFRLIDPSTTQPLDGAVTIAEDGLLAFLTPAVPFTAGRSYTVQLTAELKDTNGNPLVPFTSTFTVQGANHPLTLTPGTLTLVAGTTGTLTVGLPSAAPAGGVPITLESANPAIATVPPGILIPAGSLTNTITITALAPGTVNVTASAPGFTSATSVITVIPAAPTLTSFTPTSGKVGATITLTGTNFVNVQSVSFNGAPAPSFTVPNTTTITAVVPTGATTGPIAVTTTGGTATSTGHFVVLPTQDFSLTVEPTTVTAIAGTSVSLQVSTVTTGGFTGLTTLGTGPLPAGVTATFSPPLLGPNASGLLTLTTSGSTPSPSTIEVRGTASIEGVATTRTATATLNVQAPGATVLAGQVLDENEKPIPGVSIKLGGSTITTLGTTDAAGNFLVTLPVAGPQVFLIDGSTANTATVTYPTIPVTVTIQAGVVNTLGYTPHLMSHPRGRTIPLLPGQETVLAPAEIPGLEVRIPAGTTIIGWDGQPNTEIGVIAVPVDRSGAPPIPAGQFSRTIYAYTFGKVGGGTPSQPVPITYPNDLQADPGEPVDLYYFDEAPDGSRPNAWAKYGTGTVSADGTQILPDLDPSTGQPYGVPRFCCGYNRPARRFPPADRNRGPYDAPTQGGEPVELQTGLFVLEKTDLVLPGLRPLTITRTYRTNSSSPGPFGLGTSWTYDLFLTPPPNGSPDQLRLLLPGGSDNPFIRQPDGSYVNTLSPAFRGARITLEADQRVLRFKDGTTWRFRAADGLLLSQRDRHGNTLTLFRESRAGSLARVTTLSGPNGRSVSFSYTTSTLRIDGIQDPLGREVRYGYDAQGRLETVTDPAGGLTRYTYDAQGRMLTITDPRGITFLTNEYDSAGRVSRQTQADGGVFSFEYTVMGGFITATTVTDPRGNRTTSRFNNFGYLIEQTDALGQKTTYTREPGTNLLLATTDPLGRTTRFTYDPNGNVTSITDPGGNLRTFTYDPTFNKVTSITDPLGNVTTFGYDAQGNLTTITDPLGNATTIAYNAFGQPVTTTDPLGNTTTFEYDSVGNLVKVADPLGNTTQRTYDTVSRLIAQADPLGKTTRFSYDALNRLVQIVDALNGQTTFGYDPNGNLLTVTDARGNSTTHTYDSMDRLLTRTDPLNRQESYQYDPNGNLIQFTDRKNQVSTFTYDPLNRRTRATFADGMFTEFTYDGAGRILTATDSATGTISEEYDTLDRLLRETTPQGSIQYAYDTLGRRTTMTVNGQTPVNYTYDAASRLTQILQAPLNPATLQYDAAGRRTLLALPNGVSTAYAYDLASRLTDLSYTGPSGLLGTLSYQYDPIGNRISVGGSFARTLLPDAVPSASYDSANQQLAFGDKSMTHDQNGNLVTLTEEGRTTTFTWDARDRLINFSGSGLTAAFGYDARTRRIQKILNGQPTVYQYDAWHIVREVAGGTEASYLRLPTVDETLARAGETFLLADGLGSTLGLADRTGDLVTEYRYQPFGVTAVVGSPAANPFRFTGREMDETGLSYHRFRYFHPGLGRFLSPDPIGLLGGQVNPYVYAHNMPVSRTDPLGLLLGNLIVRGGNTIGLYRLLGTGPAEAEGAKLVDAVIGGAAAVSGVELPPSIQGTAIPGTGVVVGDVLDAATIVGAIQTFGLGTSIGAQAVGSVAAAVTVSAGSAVVVSASIAGVAGYEAGTVLNRQVLNRVPGGNPVENLFCAFLFGCQPPEPPVGPMKRTGFDRGR